MQHTKSACEHSPGGRWRDREMVKLQEFFVDQISYRHSSDYSVASVMQSTAPLWKKKYKRRKVDI